MDAAPGFALQVTEGGEGPVVRLVGDIDLASSGEVRECLHGLAGQRVTLDCSGVTFMDSTAIGVLVASEQRNEQDGGVIVLRGVQPAQMRIFEIAGLSESLNFDGTGSASSA